MSENLWTFCLFATYPKKFCGVSSGYLRFTGYKDEKIIQSCGECPFNYGWITSCICKRFFFHLITVLHLDSDSIFNIIEL